MEQPFIQKLGWSLLHFLWQGAVLGVLGAAALSCLRKSSARARYLVACLTLLAMAVTPWITFRCVRESAAPRLALRADLIPTVEERPTVTAPAAALEESPTRSDQITAPTNDLSLLRKRLEPVLPWAVAAWFTVVSVLSLRLMAGALQVRRIGRSGEEWLRDEWKERFARLVRELRISRPVRLCRSWLVEVPTVIGWLRPVILIPASALTQLTPAQLEAVLVHELAHIRRHDYVVNLLQRLVETLLFYHPAVWWISRRIDVERENCCDDMTVAVSGNRIAYARALTALEELRSAAGPLALAANGGPLLLRIRRLLGLPAETASSGWWLAAMVAILIAAAFVVGGRDEVMAQTNRPTDGLVKTAIRDGRSWRNLEDELGQKLTLGIIQEAQRSAEKPKEERNPLEARLIHPEVPGIDPVRPEPRTKFSPTTPGQRAIRDKLDSIILEEVFFDGVPLADVVKELSEEARQHDPKRNGVNFLIVSRTVTDIDPTKPTPPSTPARLDPVDLTKVIIRINPSLRNVRLGDAVDAVTKVADTPLKYSVEPWGVVLSQNTEEEPPPISGLLTPWNQAEPILAVVSALSPHPGPLPKERETPPPTLANRSPKPLPHAGEGAPSPRGRGQGEGKRGSVSIHEPPKSYLRDQESRVFTRTFRVDPDTFLTNLREQENGQAPGTNVADTVRRFFRKLGVDFPSSPTDAVQPGGDGLGNRIPLARPGPTELSIQSGKALFFSDRTGLLFVRASMEDLDAIEKAIQVLNAAPPQVNLEVKMVELKDADAKSLGFDWFLGATPASEGKEAGGGVLPAPPPTTESQMSAPSSAREPMTQRTNRPPAAGVVSGILTDLQFRAVLRALEQRPGTDLLSLPAVTTVSGRQARIEVTESRTIVFAKDAGAASTRTNSSSANTADTAFETRLVPLGPSVDLIPVVLADGVSIQLTVTPTVTEFLGYADARQFLPKTQFSTKGSSETPLNAQLPLPRFRIRQTTATATVPDGQTLVLGAVPGLMATTAVKWKNKVPVLGDIPVLGRLFRREGTSTERKNLIVFVTPTIIDPAGNRVHPAVR